MRKLIGIRKVDIPPTFTKEELDEMGAKIDKANDQAHYALNRVRDNNSPTGYATKVVGGKKYETQASKKAGYEAEYPEDAVTNNQTTDANTATDNGGNVTPNGGNGTQTAPTDEEILKLQKWIDDSYNKRKQENEDDQRRARRNLLLSSIADGLNAMHRAYTHSRGINAMPGSERIMSEKYRERLDKLKASKGKISEDYQNMLLKLRNAKTAQERADAYAEYMKHAGKNKDRETDIKKGEAENRNKNRDKQTGISQQRADTYNRESENRNKNRDELTDSQVNKNKAQADKAKSNTGSNSGSNGSRRGSGTGTGSNNKQKPLTISERATKYRNEDPEGWEKAKEKAGRKASQTDVVSQYEYMHPNGNGASGGSGGSGGGQKKRKKINGFGSQK